MTAEQVLRKNVKVEHVLAGSSLEAMLKAMGEWAEISCKEKQREIEGLKDEISRIVYLSEQPGGYHP